MLHLTLLCVVTYLPMENFSLDIQVMEHGGDGARRATRHVGDGGTTRDGDATRHDRGWAACGGALVLLYWIGALYLCFIR
jgi:hypothetical protein